jgi:UDP-N-acetylmuramoyl-tripeptide--D-alanyl-D-alanine ligase
MNYQIDLELCESLGAKVLGDWTNVRLTGVFFDHRFVINNSLFVGMEGTKFNGSEFAKSAIENGASAIIVNKQIETEIPQIVTSNVVGFITRYAKIVRERFQNKVIAVLGSAGKTTMRYFLSRVLKIDSSKILCTSRSFNVKSSIICTMLLLSNEIDYFIVECGTNHPGEIDDIARVLNPDYTIYSSIGLEHIEFFKDLQGVIDEESAIIPYTKTAVIADSSFIEKIPEKHKNHNIVFLNEQNYEILNHNLLKVKNNSNSFDDIFLELQLPHNKIYETVAKILLLTNHLNLDLHKVKSNLEKLTPVCLRGNKIVTKHRVIFDCSYNSNPTSVENTLLSISTECDFVFGAMRELGPNELEINRETIAKINENSFVNNIYVKNVDIDFSKECFSKCKPFHENNLKQIGSVVYIQGSKSNNLIDVVCGLIDDSNNSISKFVHF